MQKISKTFTIYAVFDADGNNWMGAYADFHDLAQVHGVYNSDGEGLIYEGDALGIPEWCIDNGLRCHVTKRTIEIEIV